MLLSYITLLAFSLRVYRLDEQSVWFDEFNSILLDPSASFTTFLQHIHLSNRDHVPLYFVLVFAWGKFVSASALSMRLVSVAFGCLTVPMAYRIGREVSGGKAGLVAALCVALSPINVHFSQEIRCNALLLLLAAVSVWLTLRAVKKPTLRGTVAHAAVNTVMVFTHLSAAFLVTIEFAFLVFSAGMLSGADDGMPEGPLFRIPGNADLKRLALWAGLHVPSALQCAHWIYVFGGVDSIWYTLPKPIEWLTDLLGDDAVRWSQELGMTMLGGVTNQVTRGGLLANAEDAAYLAVMLAAVLWGIMRLIRREKWRGDAVARASALRWLFVMMLLAGPLITITIASLLWHPIALPRYTLYSSFGLYALVGDMVIGLGSTKRIAIVMVLIIGIYLPQLGLVLFNYTRPDWKGAGRIVQENYRKGDLLLAQRRMPDETTQIPQAAELVTYNMDPPKLHFMTTYTYNGVLDLCDKFLGNDEGPDCAWFVLDEFTGFRERGDLEQNLAGNKLAFTHWQTTNLHIYKIWRQKMETLTAPTVDPMPPLNDDLMRKYVPDRGEGLDYSETLEALRWAVPRTNTEKDDKFNFTIMGLHAMELSPATGRAMAEHVLKTDPHNVPALFLLNYAAIALRDRVAAQAALEQLPPIEVIIQNREYPGVDAFMAGDIPKARAMAREYCALAPSRLPGFFRYLLGLETPPPGSHLVPLP